MLKIHQQGVGLLEALIALLLLAVAVLGFSAMQMRAIKATDETLYRSDAMVAIRNIAEDMRLYPTTAQKTAYMNYINSRPTAKPTDCTTTICNETQQMQYNAYESISLARDSQITIGAMTCPGINRSNSLQKVCLIASWGETQARQGTSPNDCIDGNGVYHRGATCFIMETY